MELQTKCSYIACLEGIEILPYKASSAIISTSPAFWAFQKTLPYINVSEIRKLNYILGPGGDTPGGSEIQTPRGARRGSEDLSPGELRLALTAASSQGQSVSLVDFVPSHNLTMYR